MNYNYTGMDVFDRGFEPMCYCVSTNEDDSFKKTAIDAWNHVDNINAISANVCKVTFSFWHIKRRDLLTLRG